MGQVNPVIRFAQKAHRRPIFERIGAHVRVLYLCFYTLFYLLGLKFTHIMSIISFMKHYPKSPIFSWLALALLALMLVPSGPLQAEGLPAAHQNLRCDACHVGGAAPDPASAAITQQCQSCHSQAQLSFATESHRRAKNCLACHSFHAPDQMIVANNPQLQVPLNSVDSPNCRSCHSPESRLANLSPAHRIAADIYHADAQKLVGANPSQACLNCHSKSSTSAWQQKTDGAVLAFNEHASHPYGIDVIPGAGNSSNWIARDIDPRLPLFDGKMECQTCHLLTAGTDDLLRPFEAKYDLCKGCHRQYGDKTDRALVAGITR